MSIRRDLVIKVSNGSATLDMPLRIYEKDHGIELRFKLMDYKYKYDKDPENILNSNKDDILEAYTTIVNPIGYELAQINGEVIDDTVIFMIEDSYTDELEELGIYQLQIHVKCKHSEFSIPPVQFEVLERLKGEKVVTDGDDEVDNSDIIDGSTKFIDDETGKLIIEWQKGDTISSVRLNAMVEVINNAVDEEAQRQLNEVEREQQELEREKQELERENRLQAALNSVDARVDESMNEYETRFNALTASQQQDMEVIDARDGEVSLKARLDRDLINPLQVYEDVEDSYISCDSNEGYAKDVEILGNTIQDSENLEDIRSVGDDVEGQELYEIPVLSCGKNLTSVNTFNSVQNFIKFVDLSKLKNGVYTLTFNTDGPEYLGLRQYYKDGSFILFSDGIKPGSVGFNINKTDDSDYIACWGNTTLTNIQLEEGTVATPYEPYQGDKLTILSPVQLEKVGDVADRIICKDGVWGVEKNIETVILSDNYNISWKTRSEIEIANGEYVRFHTTDIKNKSSNGIAVISNMFTSFIGSPVDAPYTGCNIFTHDMVDENIYVTVASSELQQQNQDGLREYLSNKNVFAIYQTTQPQFIPLPHDQQVKLRTFAGQTNMYFETEIEGTIKAQIPQSISSTISTHTEQIDNLNKELDRVKKLEESTVSTVVTESDFTTVEETTNGYFEDVKVEGKTLVNVIMREKVSIVGANGIIAGNENFGKSNGVYSLTSKNDTTSMRALRYEIKFPNLLDAKNLELSFCLDSPIDSAYQLTFVNEDATVTDYEVCEYTAGKIYIKYKLPTTQKIQIIRIYVDKNGVSTNTSTTFKLTDVMILEGDHTQNPTGYFEGLMSVGEDVEEVSVLSQDGMGNLFSADYWESGFIGDTAGAYSQNIDFVRTKKIRVIPNTTYNFKGYSRRIYYYDIMGNFISRFDIGGGTFSEQSDSFTTPSNCHYIALRYDITHAGASIKTLNEMKQYNTVICKGDFREGLRFEVDKKPLLYYNPTTQTWEKPILRQWDSIEKHSDGKYYYHKRSGEVVLNGSESWVNYNQNNNRISFVSNEYAIEKPLNEMTKANIISDKFNTITQDEVYNDKVGEGVSVSISCKFAIIIDKSKAQDLESFKTWLQTNPVTIVCKLKEEEVYECINIDLITYADETNYIVKSGVIVPKTTLKVHSNIGNVTTILQKKTLKLEESTITHDRRIAAIETKLETPAVQVEGSYITCDSTDGYIQNVEILGNTIQDADNLADIRSVGEEVEGQELYEIPIVSFNANLFDGNYEEGYISLGENTTGQLVHSINYRSTEFIKVKQNTTYTMRFINRSATTFYDKNKVKVGESSTITFTTNENTHYVRIYYYKPDLSEVENKDNFQLEEDTVLSPYEPYQGNKLTILSPVQLEKVGDVADRIICKDGVWGVEKNITDLILNGDEVWVAPATDNQINTKVFRMDVNELIENSLNGKNICISDTYKTVNTQADYITDNIEYICASAKKIYIRIKNEKLTTLDVSGFKQYLEKNNVMVKYQTATSTFIQLPHDQQVKLRTFEGQTNIYFETEIEGTIKASIPQSISSTISTHTEQIDNLNKELNRVKKLEESTVSTVTTESDFTTVEQTTNGYFEDVKLEGKTLVNLCEDRIFNYSNEYPFRHFRNWKMLKPDTEYTFLLYGDTSTFSSALISDNNVREVMMPRTYTNTPIIKFKTPSNIQEFTLDQRVYIYSSTNAFTEEQVSGWKLAILEGDHTQNPPSYFEGLMSVGDGVDEVSVESCNTNLVEYMEVGGVKWADGGDYVTPSYIRTNYIKVKPQQTYYIKHATFINYSTHSVYMYAHDKSYLGYVNITGDSFETKPGTRFIRFEMYKASGTAHTPEEIANCDFMVSVDKIVNYIPHQLDKKPLLYYNNETQTWEKPILREWDSIEKHSDSKYYYHKRSEEVLLDGSENWETNWDNDPTYIRFVAPAKLEIKTADVYCDKFPSNGEVTDKETMFTYKDYKNNLFVVSIARSKLTTQDAEGFKQWLQANPTTVVYQLAQEEVYECINIDLITYENETNFIVNTGVIAPKTTLKVICNITNVVRELQQKVSNLENYIQHVMIDALNNALNE